MFGKSLSTITLHTFLSFIDKNHTRDNEFVKNRLVLDDIDWRQLIKNSKKQGLEFKGMAVTDYGKPLL